MLRIASPEKVYALTILGTVFHIKSLSIFERKEILIKILNLDNTLESFKDMVNIIAPAIDSIDGYDDVKKTLEQLEFVSDLGEIVKAIINYSSLSEVERKNLASSSESNITISTGIAE